MNYFNVGITVNPTEPPLPPPSPPPDYDVKIDPKLLAIMKKYKYNWRISTLAQPRWPRMKYDLELLQERPKEIKINIDKELEYYTDHLARAKLGILTVNRKYYTFLGKKFRTKINKCIKKSWASKYNHYKKILRDREIEAKKKVKKVKRPDFDKMITESSIRLSKPRKRFDLLVKKKKRKFMKLEDLKASISKLSTPREYNILPPKTINVSPTALSYVATERILKLASAIPQRYQKSTEKPIMAGAVKRGALKYKITPKIEELSKPRVIEKKGKEDEKDEPWKINPFALKYKATQRIIDLAKPRERD